MTNICMKNEKLEVNKDDIWQGDLFGRKTVADDFSKIITSICQPFVLSVNAPYGSGKSFFLERWEEQLKQADEKTVFFNAWDYDFIEKPLLPFLHEFLKQLIEIGLVEYDIKKDFKDCKDIIVTVSNEMIKKASGGVFDPKKFEGSISKGLPIIAGEPLDEYKELKSAIDIFKTTLQTEVQERLQGENIYIFVDELERCRPTFAIELLEAIKHLFNVKGLVFILGIDRSQLKHTVSTIYGQGMDGDGYLRRFIDLELSLPEIAPEKYSQHLCKMFDIKNADVNNSNTWTCGHSEFNNYFNIFAKAYKLSLREIEQIYAKFSIITKIVPEGYLLITPALAFLLIIKIKNKKLYDDFTSLSINSNDIYEIVYREIGQAHTAEKLINFMALLISIFDYDYKPQIESLKQQLNPLEPNSEEIEIEIDILERAVKRQYHIEDYNLREAPILYLAKLIEYIYSSK